MTATKKTTRIDPKTLKLLRNIADAIWDLGEFHIYHSQWMKNPAVEGQYVAPCGMRNDEDGTVRLEMGYVTVSIGDEYSDGIFVSVLMQGIAERKCYHPSLDFPANWNK